MKSTIIVTLLLACSASTAFAQQGDYARFVPAKPRVGDTLRIEYDAGEKEALLYGAETIEAVISPILLGEALTSHPLRIRLTLSGHVLRGKVGIVTEKAVAYICKFSSDAIEDRNMKRAWLCFVHDPAGKPVPYAHLFASLYYCGGVVNEFEIGRNDEMRLGLLAEEARLHPGRSDAHLEWCLLKLQTDSNDVMKEFVRRVVDSCYLARRQSGYSTEVLLNFLEAFGRSREADTLRALNAERSPASGKVAITAVRVGSDDSSAMQRRKDRGANVVPWTSERASHYQQNLFFDSLAAHLPVDSAVHVMETAGYHFPSVYAVLTLRELLNEGNPLKAQDIARHGIDMIRNRNPDGWLDAIPGDDDYFRDESRGLSTLIEYFIYALVASDQFSTALEFSRMVFTRTQARSTHLNHIYSALLLDTASFEEHHTMLRNAFERGTMNDSMLANWRTILARDNRAESDLLDTARAIFTREHHRNSMRLRSSMVKEAPRPFILQTAHGAPLLSEALKGKTTVLMFWHDLATPPGFFSAVSELCTQAGHNPDVAFVSVFLFLNPPQRDEMSLDGEFSTVPTTFLSEAQQLMPCATATYSDGRVGGAFPAAMSRQYVILDRNGFIRFKGDRYTNALQYAHDWLERIRLVLEER